MKRIIFQFLILLLSIVPAISENKTALLIANGRYSHFPSLATPVSEAGWLKSALERLDFRVTLLTDSSREEMLEGLSDFEKLVKERGGIALFHYGGHAVQVEGKNYLIPADADIPDERRVVTRAVDAEEVMATLEASGSDTNIVILDSCRNNPLPGDVRSVVRGLAVTGRKPPNSIIVYSAESGTTAMDGVFTPTLLSFLEQPGLSFTDILRKTRQKVYDITKGSQIPGSYDQLFQPIYLSNRTPVETSVGSGNLIHVSGGVLSMGSINGHDNERPVHNVSVSSFYMSQYEVTQGEWESIMGTSVVQQRDMINPDWPLKGISSNLPMYYINWHEAVVYCNLLSQKEGLDPVYSFSKDSVSLNRESNGYRLPTEAEWEYAARGGSLGRGYSFAGSNDPGSVAWYFENSGDMVHPVGEKQPNELGMYDMSGNVYEWCWDIFAGYGESIQSDPYVLSLDEFRVNRGGSWGDGTGGSRVSFRGSLNPFFRFNDVGFRVVRRP